MKILSGLFHIARKRAMTKDGEGSFRERITALVDNRGSLTDEGVSKEVEELKALAATLPDGEEKDKLVRFLEDFKSVKEQDEAAAKEAAKMVSDLFEKLDAEADKDTPGAKDALLSVNASGNNVSAANAGANNGVSKDGVIGNAFKAVTGANDGDSGEDGEAEAKAKDSGDLEEIYQYIKRRMEEDSCADGVAGEPDADEGDGKKGGVASDHAPRVPVTFGASGPRVSLAEMFAKIKEGRM